MMYNLDNISIFKADRKCWFSNVTDFLLLNFNLCSQFWSNVIRHPSSNTITHRIEKAIATIWRPKFPLPKNQVIAGAHSWSNLLLKCLPWWKICIYKHIGASWACRSFSGLFTCFYAIVAPHDSSLPPNHAYAWPLVILWLLSLHSTAWNSLFTVSWSPRQESSQSSRSSMVNPKLVRLISVSLLYQLILRLPP